MKAPYDEPNTKEHTKENLFTQNDGKHPTNKKGEIEKDESNNRKNKGLKKLIKKKIKLMKLKFKKISFPAWLCFTVLLLVLATYEYFTLGKRLSNLSLAILVCSVYALHLIIKYTKTVKDIKENNFFIRFFHAKKPLLKLQKLAIWFDEIKPWQRLTILISILSIGFLFL